MKFRLIRFTPESKCHKVSERGNAFVACSNDNKLNDGISEINSRESGGQMKIQLLISQLIIL